MSECSISFPGTVSRRTICHLVIDFMKYVLYFRGQFPLPLDQLKKSVMSIDPQSPSNERCMIDNHPIYRDRSDQEGNQFSEVAPRSNVRAKQLFVEAVTRFDNFFSELLDILENQNILEVVLNLGPNMMNPKEMYHIKLPFYCSHLECSKDFQSLPKCKLQFFREIMQSSLWADLKSDHIHPISILLLLGPDVSLSESFEQKRFYTVPTHCKARTLHFSVNCTHLNDTVTVADKFQSVSSCSKQGTAMQILHQAGLWVKMKTDLKGFKCSEKNLSVLNGQLLC